MDKFFFWFLLFANFLAPYFENPAYATGGGMLTQPRPDEFGMRQRSGEYFDPNPMFSLVEASHANAYARAIAFFSYIWFKYDILSLQCCKLGGLV